MCNRFSVLGAQAVVGQGFEGLGRGSTYFAHEEHVVQWAVFKMGLRGLDLLIIPLLETELDLLH